MLSSLDPLQRGCLLLHLLQERLGGRICGIQPDCVPQMDQGVVPLAFLHQEFSQIEMRPPFIGFTVDRSPERGDGAGIVPQFFEAMAQILVCERESGLELDGSAKTAGRRWIILLKNQGNPQVILGLGHVRPQRWLKRIVPSSLQQLTTLNLAHNDIGEAGALALA